MMNVVHFYSVLAILVAVGGVVQLAEKRWPKFGMALMAVIGTTFAVVLLWMILSGQLPGPVSGDGDSDAQCQGTTFC